uniref:Uncharacterized protein n=1 Tax=Leersia perrieri TaxID=77586 RepID=A0A0D9VY45_9ORYZ
MKNCADHLHLEVLYLHTVTPTKSWWHPRPLKCEKRREKTALLGDSFQLMVKGCFIDGDTAVVSIQATSKLYSAQRDVGTTSIGTTHASRLSSATFAITTGLNHETALQYNIGHRTGILTCTRSTPREHLVIAWLLQMNKLRYNTNCYVSDFVGGSSFNPLESKS